MSQSSESESLKKILRAAKEEFSNFGFNGARIDRIAKIASINKAMIYYHFKNKLELYEAVIDSIFSKDEHKSLNQIKFPNTYDKLLYIIQYFFDKMETDKIERCSIIAREMVSQSEIFYRMRDKYWIPDFKILGDVLEEGKERGEFSYQTSKEFICFTIISHIVFYKISEVTYNSSEIFSSLYPANNQSLMKNYLKMILDSILFSNNAGMEER